jgi:DNA-binding FadR family transcriptional regulator
MTRSESRRRKRDVVVEQLKHFIRSRQLTVGDRLPTETALAERFGVSRLSLREATKSLELLGILHAKPGVGLTVCELDFARVSQHLTFHPAVGGASPQELIDTRVVIETGAIPYAVARIHENPSILASLQKMIPRFENAQTLGEKIALDIKFHRMLLDASGLKPLVAFSELLEIFFRQFRQSVDAAEWTVSIASHQRIINSLRDRDVSGVVNELRTHIESHKLRMEPRK